MTSINSFFSGCHLEVLAVQKPKPREKVLGLVKPLFLRKKYVREEKRGKTSDFAGLQGRTVSFGKGNITQPMIVSEKYTHEI